MTHPLNPNTGAFVRATTDLLAPDGIPVERVSSGSTAYAGISLEQPGLQLAAGGLYTVTLSARAATEREILFVPFEYTF